MALLKRTPEQRLARERAEADAKAAAGKQSNLSKGIGSAVFLIALASWYFWNPQSSTGTVYLRGPLDDGSGYVYVSHTIKVSPPDVVLLNGQPVTECTVIDQQDWTCRYSFTSTDGKLSLLGGEQIGFLHYWLGSQGFLSSPTPRATPRNKTCEESWAEREWKPEDFKRAHPMCVMWLESRQ